MNLNTEIEKLIHLYKTLQVDEFKKQHTMMKHQFPSVDEKNIIDNALKEAIAISFKEDEKKINEIEEACLKLQLKEVTEVISLSYVAKKYFNRSRNWLYQRINGNIVRGKVARFTDAELDKLQFAINDIGQQLNSFRISKI